MSGRTRTRFTQSACFISPGRSNHRRYQKDDGAEIQEGKTSDDPEPDGPSKVNADAKAIAQRPILVRRQVDGQPSTAFGLKFGDKVKGDWLQEGLRYIYPFDYEVRIPTARCALLAENIH